MPEPKPEESQPGRRRAKAGASGAEEGSLSAYTARPDFDAPAPRRAPTAAIFLMAVGAAGLCYVVVTHIILPQRAPQSAPPTAPQLPPAAQERRAEYALELTLYDSAGGSGDQVSVTANGVPVRVVTLDPRGTLVRIPLFSPTQPVLVGVQRAIPGQGALHLGTRVPPEVFYVKETPQTPMSPYQIWKGGSVEQDLNAGAIKYFSNSLDMMKRSISGRGQLGQ